MFLYFILNKEEAYELVKKVTDNVSLNKHTCLNVERCQRWNQQRKKKGLGPNHLYFIMQHHSIIIEKENKYEN